MVKKYRKKKSKHTALTWTILILGKSIWDLFKNIFKLLIYVLKSFLQIGTLILKIKNFKLEKIRFVKSKSEFKEMSLVKKVRGSFKEFEDRLNKESLIVLIIGKRGAGKSAMGFSLLENIHSVSKREVFVMGVKQSVLPKWILSVDSMDNVRNGGVLLIDEGALEFSSRDSMSNKNKNLGKLLAIARHKDLTLLFVTQNTGMLDKNVLNLADSLLFKAGSLLQEQMERPAIKSFYETARKHFPDTSSRGLKPFVYVFDDDFEGLVKTFLPSFWSNKISKNKL